METWVWALLIIGILLLLGGIGTGLYFVFKPSDPTPPPPNQKSSGGSDSGGSGGSGGGGSGSGSGSGGSNKPVTPNDPSNKGGVSTCSNWGNISTPEQAVCASVALLMKKDASLTGGMTQSYQDLQNASKLYPWWSATLCDMQSNALFLVYYFAYHSPFDVNQAWNAIVSNIGGASLPLPTNGDKSEAQYWVAFWFNALAGANIIPTRNPNGPTEYMNQNTLDQVNQFLTYGKTCS